MPGTFSLRGLLTLIVCNSALVTSVSAQSYFEKTLLDKQIKPTAVGLNDYFSSLHLDEAQRQRALKLIEQLGTTESFASREAAMSQLVIMPVLPTESLMAASKGSDPEIRWRAKQVLKLGKPESERILYAALKTIEKKKLPGIASELVRAIPLCDKPHLRFAARQALIATSRAADAAVLRKALGSTNTQVRIAAAGALSRAIGDKSAAQLYPLLKDARDDVKLAAARAIANFGDRKSLPVFLALLSSDDVNARVGGAAALRELTGQRFNYAAFGTPTGRDKAAANWKGWVATAGKTAKLKFPLKPFGTGVSYLNGNTLLAYGYQNRVVEFDPSGREVWSFAIPGAWSAEKLANGNVLIASNTGGRVVEVDKNKKIVWEHRIANPLNAKMLQNGNILIAQHGGGAAIEITHEKKVVWSYRTHGRSGNCSDMHRLDNGNTLVASYGFGVMEITLDGKIVWQNKTPACYGCQPLPNGNVLIADISGRVIEVTRDNKVVWEFQETNPVDVFRLPNGNTLITGSNRFIEVTPDKKIVWSKAGCSFGSARR